jgi:hypothetical protein
MSSCFVSFKICDFVQKLFGYTGRYFQPGGLLAYEIEGFSKASI